MTTLIGALHRTTLHVSIDLWRSEARRRAREEHAVAMQPIPEEDRSRAEIRPCLDEALDELENSDREVILLRFFNHKSMRELGDSFGITEDAAKMRVSRAVARLRDQLGAAGVTCTTAAVGAFLGEHAVEAAPAGVAAAIAALSDTVAKGGAAAAGEGAAVSLPAWMPLAKLAAGIGALAFLGAATWFAVHRSQVENRSGIESQAGVLSATARARRASPLGTQDTTVTNKAHQPDPAGLLQAAIRARERIVSGSVAFQVSTFFPTQRATNQWRVAAVFDGAKRRFEQFGREYSYTYDPDPERAKEIQAKADAFGPDRVGAVQAGLLKEFASHHVTIYDGTALMDYWETDGKPRATVDDPSRGSAQFVFDPRCLGVSPSLSLLSSLERCLGSDRAGSPQMVGQETVDGAPAWHVRVLSDPPREIWLEVAHPSRVLKFQSGSWVAVSKYDPATPSNPLPQEVTNSDLRDGVPGFGTRFVQTSSQFFITVEPATFTLEGLGMKVGTSVVDVRIHRSIGYWTGTGLSENLPRKTAEPPKDARTLADMLAILDNADPASDVVFDAAQWILLNTQDGPAVEKAARSVLENQVRRPDLAPLCEQMERLRHQSMADFLAAVLKDNPHPEVQAAACFALATLRKDQSKFGEDKKMAAEAEALFERVINQFGQARLKAADYSRKANEALSELRRMSVGKVAPDFEGTDLQGQPIRLSALRGKVVAVVFWYASNWVTPEENLTVLAPFAERGLVCLSIYCDDDRNRAMPVLEKYPPPRTRYLGWQPRAHCRWVAGAQLAKRLRAGPQRRDSRP